MKSSPCLIDYLTNQTAEETVEVLDEALSILVLHTEHVGISDKLSHQYLTIRNLRDVFAQMKGG